MLQPEGKNKIKEFFRKHLDKIIVDILILVAASIIVGTTSVVGSKIYNRFLGDEGDELSQPKQSSSTTTIIGSSSTGENKNDPKEWFTGSLYGIVDQLSKIELEIDREEFFKRFVGLKVRESGYINNISELDRYFLVSFKQKNEDIFSSVTCDFDPTWMQALVTRTKQLIVFSGVIESQSFSRISLVDCKLE